jgi:hypothetical protein
MAENEIKQPNLSTGENKELRWKGPTEEPTKEPTKGPAVSRYWSLGETFLIISTFAGSITFSSLLAIKPGDAPEQVQSLLGFATALFLGSITLIFPIILALQPLKDEEDLEQEPIRWRIVVTGYTIVAAFMSVAFFLVIIVLKYFTDLGAFILGVTILSINVLLAIVVQLYNLDIWFKRGLQSWLPRWVQSWVLDS